MDERVTEQGRSRRRLPEVRIDLVRIPNASGEEETFLQALVKMRGVIYVRQNYPDSDEPELAELYSLGVTERASGRVIRRLEQRPGVEFYGKIYFSPINLSQA